MRMKVLRIFILCHAPLQACCFAIQKHHASRVAVSTIVPSKLELSSSDSDCSTGTEASLSPLRSYIRTLQADHLAGVSTFDGKAICIMFQPDDHLVAVTGETGSGKSLLVARSMELLAGCKASVTLLDQNQNQPASVSMEVVLHEPYLSAAQDLFEQVGLDPSSLFEDQGTCILHVERTMMVQEAGNGKPRIRSICKINGDQVTLKTLSMITSPLIAIVDASAASVALAKPSSRMAMLDTGVSQACLQEVITTQDRYRLCRDRREELEDDLASRTLPLSFAPDSEKNVELLSHWIAELDAFESRVISLCSSLIRSEFVRESALADAGRELASTRWREGSSDRGLPFSSTLYQKLLNFREMVAALDRQLESARDASRALGCLSSKGSAITAVERTRNLLFDALSDHTSSQKLACSSERAHDLLNLAEKAILDCANFLEDDSEGLIRALEMERELCKTSMNDMDAIILDWNTLSRKHGISCESLPSCHYALQCERDGTVEAQKLLPQAMFEEKEALEHFEQACEKLSTKRKILSDQLSLSVTARLPSLSMEKAVFRSALNTNIRLCTDPSTFKTKGVAGVDSLDFFLIHDGNKDGVSQGYLHEVASSGEKARLLLAMECTLPGSVGASLRAITAIADDPTSWSTLPPIAVVYDEIDAHVGGNAAVALSGMLADQSKTNQVIAITHNPSVAAVADVHVVVEKVTSDSTTWNAISVTLAEGQKRTKELARMASGDLAMEEAELFAGALIRDGARRRKSTS